MIRGSSRLGKAVALTGGIACGKSAVGEILAGLGAAVLDSDAVAHELLRKGSPVYGRVVAAFGPGIVAPGGDVDRKKLGAIVFSDAKARQKLNDLTHPEIVRRVWAWVKDETAAGRDAVALIPLLFEIGAEQGWDATVCVVSDEPAVFERLRARGWSEEEIRKRLAAQWPVAEKARRASAVIVNNGTIEQLRAETARVYRQLREKEK